MCHHRRMHRRWNRVVAAALLTMLTLSGCVRADADLEVSRANTISGTIQILAPLADESEASMQAVAGQVTTIEQRVLPGLRDQPGVTASAVTPEPGLYGTELVLDALPLEQLRLGEITLISREESDFLVSGTLDATGQPDVPMAAAEGERPAGAAESSIRLALTFPGDVTDVAGSVDAAVVDGPTVTWETTYDVPITLDATASATSSAFPDWTWRAVVWGVGAIVVLAVAGLITVAVRARHDG